jgi:hypothetical protein
MHVCGAVGVTLISPYVATGSYVTDVCVVAPTVTDSASSRQYKGSEPLSPGLNLVRNPLQVALTVEKADSAVAGVSPPSPSGAVRKLSSAGAAAAPCTSPRGVEDNAAPAANTAAVVDPALVSVASTI